MRFSETSSMPLQTLMQAVRKHRLKASSPSAPAANTRPGERSADWVKWRAKNNQQGRCGGCGTDWQPFPKRFAREPRNMAAISRQASGLSQGRITAGLLIGCPPLKIRDALARSEPLARRRSRSSPRQVPPCPSWPAFRAVARSYEPAQLCSMLGPLAS
jgi:hypothetical protein